MTQQPRRTPAQTHASSRVALMICGVGGVAICSWLFAVIVWTSSEGSLMTRLGVGAGIVSAFALASLASPREPVLPWTWTLLGASMALWALGKALPVPTWTMVMVCAAAGLVLVASHRGVACQTLAVVGGIGWTLTAAACLAHEIAGHHLGPSLLIVVAALACVTWLATIATVALPGLRRGRWFAEPEVHALALGWSFAFPWITADMFIGSVTGPQFDVALTIGHGLVAAAPLVYGLYVFAAPAGQAAHVAARAHQVSAIADTLWSGHRVVCLLVDGTGRVVWSGPGSEHPGHQGTLESRSADPASVANRAPAEIYDYADKSERAMVAAALLDATAFRHAAITVHAQPTGERVRLTMQPLSGGLIGVAVQRRDDTETQLAQLRALAQHDQTTGALLGAAFRESGAQLARDETPGVHVVCAHIDIAILGEDSGDEDSIWRSAVQRLIGAADESHRVGRTGPTRVSVAFTTARLPEVRATLGSLVSAAVSPAAGDAAQALRVATRVGFATCATPADFHDVYARAEVARREAIKDGWGSITNQTRSPRSGRPIERRQGLAAAMVAPIACADTQEAVGLWFTRDREDPVTDAVDRFQAVRMIAAVAGHMAAWTEATENNITLYCPVNGPTLSWSGFAGEISELLLRHRLSPGRVVLAVPNSDLRRCTGVARHTIVALRKMGVGIGAQSDAHDVFSPQVLAMHDVTDVLLDFSAFTSHSEYARVAGVMRGCVKLAHDTRARTIVFNVDTEGAAERARACGAWALAGDAVGSPLPARHGDTLVRSGHSLISGSPRQRAIDVTAVESSTHH